MKPTSLGRNAWLYIPAASLVPAFLDAGQMWLKQLLDEAPATDWGAIVFQGVEWIFLGVLAPIAWYLARRFPVRQVGWKRALAVHGAGALVLCIGWATLGVVLARLLNHWVAYGALGQAYLNWVLTSVPWSVFMYFTVLGCVYAFVYFNEAKDRELQSAHLGAQLADARLGALRMQLHPHFLFNSLNTLAVFVRERNTPSASRMLELLGDMLRRLLKSDRPHEVALADELEFVEQYLAIETMRFPDRLHVVWSVDPEARRARVPDMLLQPLVENAIRHGVAMRTRASRVEILANVEPGVLRLTVRDVAETDTPTEIRGQPGEGVGLANTRERLNTLYGSSARLTLHDLPERGTEVVVELPFRTEGEQ